MTLSDFKTPDGFITIAPFDHRGSLAKSLSLDLTKPQDSDTFLFLKNAFMKILSPYVSAVLTDPELGLQTVASKAVHTGLFLSLEKSGYTGDYNSMTELLPNWGIDGVKKYNAGAKILVYFNPKHGLADQKIEMVQNLYREAKEKGVIFLVEPVMYPLEGQTQWEKEYDDYWVELYLDTCRRFAPICDILKIQYPGSPKACEEVSIVHENWILLSRGVDFETFSQYLKIARRAGCVGYAAGRAVWQELTEKPREEWEEFLQEVSVPRLLKLNSLLQTSTLIT